MEQHKLSQFIAEVVLTSHYLAEPVNKTDLEVSDAEMRCLKIIQKFAPITMHEIAIKLHASKPRASQLVALLESRALVSRSVADDRRKIDVIPTDEGTAAIALLDERYDKLAAAIEHKLGVEDTKTLVRLLELITPLSKIEAENEPSK